METGHEVGRRGPHHARRSRRSGVGSGPSRAGSVGARKCRGKCKHGSASCGAEAALLAGWLRRLHGGVFKYPAISRQATEARGGVLYILICKDF